MIWAVLRWAILLLVLAGVSHLSMDSCGSPRKLFLEVSWLSTERDGVHGAICLSSSSRRAWAWSHGGHPQLPRPAREKNAARPLETSPNVVYSTG